MNNDQKNMILAFVLSGVVLVGWQLLVGLPQMDKQKQQQQQQQQQQTTTPTTPSTPDTPQPKPDKDKEKEKKPFEDKVLQKALEHLRGELKKAQAQG